MSTLRRIAIAVFWFLIAPATFVFLAVVPYSDVVSHALAVAMRIDAWFLVVMTPVGGWMILHPNAFRKKSAGEENSPSKSR